MKKLCIYHAPCQDGFGAALAVKLKYEDDVELFAGIHGNSPPDVTDREVIIVDFSYQRDVIIEMAKTAKSILIIDHHKSAEKDLVDLPDNVTVVFDMNQSGAVLTWKYYHDKPVPKLYQHIQDRDLWRFELDGTREISAGLFSYPYDFDQWEMILDYPTILDDLIVDGRAITRNKYKEIEEYLIDGVQRANVLGYNIPIVNMPYFYSSDVGHILAEGEPFAICYYDKKDGREFSLRSSDEAGSVDVSEIATRFGGGGHAKAAGFRISFNDDTNFDDIFTFVCDEEKF